MTTSLPVRSLNLRRKLQSHPEKQKKTHYYFPHFVRSQLIILLSGAELSKSFRCCPIKFHLWKITRCWPESLPGQSFSHLTSSSAASSSSSPVPGLCWFVSYAMVGWPECGNFFPFQVFSLWPGMIAKHNQTNINTDQPTDQPRLRRNTIRNSGKHLNYFFRALRLTALFRVEILYGFEQQSTKVFALLQWQQ